MRDKKKPTPQQRGYKPTERSDRASRMYNTTQWRKIRDAYLMENPECVICGLFGRVKLANCVHHHDHISDARNDLEAMDIAFDSNNLVALCSDCHNLLHAILRHGALRPEDKELLKRYNEYIRKRRMETNR